MSASIASQLITISGPRPSDQVDVLRGSQARYHGSMESEHGLYVITGLCWCDYCGHAWDAANALPDTEWSPRFTLAKNPGAKKNHLEHVRRESFTVCGDEPSDTPSI